MADILISKFTTQIPRVGATPATPGFAESEGQDPVNPSGSPLVYTPVTIGSPANGLSISGTQVLSLALASAGVTGALSGTDWSTFNGKIGGSLTSGRIPFATGANALNDDSALTWDNVNKELLITDIALKRSASNSFVINADVNSIESNTIRSLISGGGDPLFPNKIGFATKPNGTDFTPTGWSDDTGYVANSAQVALISGGYDHVNNQIAGTIVGGGHNFIKYNIDGHSIIGGGSYNLISAGRSGIFSGRRNTVTGSFLFSGVFGGDNNNIASSYSFIGSGLTNSISGNYSSILSGSNITITSQYSIVSGNLNTASGIYSIIHGQSNNSSAQYGVVFGQSNSVSVVGASYSSIIGGFQNTASGFFSTILGGRANQASGDYSYSAGRRSISSASGAWSISDSQDADSTNSVANSWRSRFSGGYRFTGGNVGIGDISATNKLDIDGDLRIRSVLNEAGNFLTISATGIVRQRTAAEVRSDINAITGTVNLNQVAYGAGSNALTSNSNFTFSSANDGSLSLTSLGSPYQISLFTASTTNTSRGRIGDYLTNTYIEFYNSALGNMRIVNKQGSNSFGNILFEVGSTPSEIARFTNSGQLWIGTTSGTNTLDINGTARIRTISNLGTAATSVFVPSATGVVSLRTVSELASDLGAVTITGTQTITGDKTFTGRIIRTGFLTNNSQVAVGSLELQSFSQGNGWLAENAYYNGTSWKYRNTGAAGLFYFYGNEGQFRFFESGTANADLPSSGNIATLKTTSTGNFAVGLMNEAKGNYTNARLLVFGSSGNVSIGNIIDSGFRLDITGNSRFTGNTTFTGKVIIGTEDPSSDLSLVKSGTTIQAFIRNTSNTGFADTRIVLANDTNVQGGLFLGSSTRPLDADTVLVYANKTLRFMSNNTVSSGGTDPIIFQAGGNNTSQETMRILGGTGGLQFAESKNIIFGTTTGTKIGTATNQKIGFFNATPIIQPSGDILTALSNLGLVASPTITQVDQFSVKTTASADQTLPSGTLTILDYDTTLTNNSTATYTVGTTGRITINTTGIYTITAGVVIEADAVTALESAFLGIFRNGDLVAISSINTTIAAGAQSGLSTSTILSLTATDIIDCRALVNSVGGVANGLARRLGTLLGANATQVNSLSITKNSM